MSTSSGSPAVLDSETNGPPRASPGRPLVIARLQPLVPLAFAVAVCSLAVLLISRLSHELDYRATVRVLRELPLLAVVLSIAATGLSFLALVGRELCALRYVGVRLPASMAAIVSFCGSALGNVIGLGPLSGGATRFYLYHGMGLGADAIAGVIAFVTIASAIDVALLAALGAGLAASEISTIYQAAPITVAAIAWLFVAATLLLIVLWIGRRTVLRLRGFALPAPTTPVFAAQLLFVGLDIFSAAAALWFLLPNGRIGLLPFTAIFAVATALGLLSAIPAGLGVFDVIVFAAVADRSDANTAAAAVLAYRGIYFVLPMLAATALLAAFEVRGVAGRARAAIADIATRSTPALTPQFIAVVVFIVGMMLLASGATPSFGSRLAQLRVVVPLWVVEAGHFLSSIDGIILLFVVPGLARRLDGAWWAALALMLLAFVFALAKGLAFVEAGLTLAVVAILFAGKPAFTQRATIFAAQITPTWCAAVIVIAAAALWLLFFAYHDTAYTHDLWWQFAFDAAAPRSLRTTVAMCVLALAYTMWQLLRPYSGRAPRPTPDETKQAEHIILGQDRAEAFLALLGDKSFLFSRSGRAMLAYAKHGRSWIALFDPIGPREEWRELIWRFIELAGGQGGRAAFYEIGDDALSLYLDAGLTVVKIGEEARIDLAAFSLAGARRAELRYALKRGERDGLTVEYIRYPDAATVADLHAISDSWFGGRRRREMAFSVAAFRDAHVAKQHLALVRQNGAVVGLVSVMWTDHRGEAAIGIMRHRTEASPHVMRFLFTSIILRCKEQGFQWLSLGMAPFAGLDEAPLRSPWHQIVGLIRRGGGPFYNFRGLHDFKDSFGPVWRSRFYAASGTVGPYVALVDVAALARPSASSEAG
jgi:phosphatidylglycerol lysyltransferase